MLQPCTDEGNAWNDIDVHLTMPDGDYNHLDGVAPKDMMSVSDWVDDFLDENDFDNEEEDALLERLTDGSCDEEGLCEPIDEREQGVHSLQVPWLSEPILRENQGKGTPKLATPIMKAPLRPGCPQQGSESKGVDDELLQTALAQGMLPRPCVGVCARSRQPLQPTPTRPLHGCH